MGTGLVINIIRTSLLFFIFLTGVISIVVNERKKMLQARRKHIRALADQLEQRAAPKPLRPQELNIIATIIALKDGARSLAVVVGVLSLCLILIECYLMFVH